MEQSFYKVVQDGHHNANACIAKHKKESKKNYFCFFTNREVYNKKNPYLVK